MPTFEKRTLLPVSPETLFAWHARPGAFERLNPPWEPAEVLSRTGGIEPGSRVTMRMHLGPLPLTWEAEHRALEPGRQFQDVQLRGPFARWEHTHRFEPAPEGAWLVDRLVYEAPLGGLGAFFGQGMITDRLERVFRYRHAVTAADLSLQQRLNPGKSLRVAVTGAGGLLGSALLPFLTTAGHEVLSITRGKASRPGILSWDPSRGTLPPEPLEGLDAVIHLAGESISGRWTPARKAAILQSRAEGTRLLANTLASLKHPPKVLVSASAVGFYGDAGDGLLTEGSSRGEGFLADVCEAWEAATEPVRAAGIRVVNLRFGVVLSPRGGALQKLLLPFSLGAGGPVGHGRQFMSWIGLDDAVGALYQALCDARLSGPVNATAPQPVTSRDFARGLGRVLSRPAFVPTPAFALRLAMGEQVDELLLASQRAMPQRLLEAGYVFRHPTLEGALSHVLGRALPPSGE